MRPACGKGEMEPAQNGEIFLSGYYIGSVLNEQGIVTNYVASLVDIRRKNAEQKSSRLLRPANRVAQPPPIA